MKQRQCRRCRLMLQSADFPIISSRRSLYCKDCQVGKRERLRKNGRDFYRKSGGRERTKAYRRGHVAKYLIYAAKTRSKQYGLEFELSESDIVVPKVCPVLGIPLQLGVRQAQAGSPTLDRIDPRLGYVRGNVNVISYRANTLKSDATVAELEAVLRYMKSALAVAVTFADTKRKDVAA